MIRVGPICQTCQAARREREGADKTGRVCVGGRGSLVRSLKLQKTEVVKLEAAAAAAAAK